MYLINKQVGVGENDGINGIYCKGVYTINNDKIDII